MAMAWMLTVSSVTTGHGDGDRRVGVAAGGKNLAVAFGQAVHAQRQAAETVVGL
jgi:hypothetical protein